MKIKKACEECGKVHTAAKLHRSIDTHKYLCYVCWTRNNKIRNKRKLSRLTKQDKELSKSTPVIKKSSRAMRLLKYGVRLLKGEESI